MCVLLIGLDGYAVDLSMHMVLPKAGDPVELDFEKECRLYVSNETARPISWRLPEGEELTFAFRNEASGATTVMRRDQWSEKTGQVEILPGEARWLAFRFAGNDQDPGPAPNTDIIWSVTAILKMDGFPKLESHPTRLRRISRGFKLVADFIQAGFTNRAKELMEADDRWITDQRRALDVAVRENHLDLVKWMIDYDGEVNPIDTNVVAPIFYASRPEMAKLLIDAGADLRRLNRGQNVLQHAADRFSWSGVDSVHWRGVTKIYRREGLQLDLEAAIDLGELKVVQKILQQSPELAGDGLWGAAWLGRYEICKALLETPGFSFRRVGYEHSNPVVAALKYPRIVKLLIDARADLNVVVKGGALAGARIVLDQGYIIHHAMVRAEPVTVKMLLDHGADPFAVARDSFDRNGRQSALEAGAIAWKYENARILLEHPRYVSGRAALRQWMLDESLVAVVGSGGWGADESDQIKLIDLLTAKGARVTGREAGRMLPELVMLLLWGDEDYRRHLRAQIQTLSKHGAKVDLFTAVGLGDLALVKKLLSVEPRRANDRGPGGLPVLHLAVTLGLDEVVRELLDAGVNVNTRNLHRESLEFSTALHWAAYRNHAAIAETLIAAGARVDARGSRRNPPLFQAALFGSVEVARLLLKNGARADFKDDGGMNALDWARSCRERNGEGMVRLLKNY